MPNIGAVACGHPLTAEAALIILEEGGNAFDAVIAAQFAACVAEPVLASLGGGGFLLAAPAAARPRLYDFFVHSPKSRTAGDEALLAIEADFGPATQTFYVGAGTIATPGTVAGMFSIHRDLATMPLQRLIEPAVSAARAGLTINEFQGYIFDIVRSIYTNTSFSNARSGTHLRQTELADSLEALAREGPGLFYQGEVARRLVRLCSEQGGHLRAEDLAGYSMIEREPLGIDYRGYRILTNPLPSAGGVLIGHALGQLGGRGAHPTEMLQAMAATNEARTNLLGSNDQVSRGTTHISVIDRMGNMASMSLSNGEGSGCAIPGTGIMTNNMLGEEDINPLGIGRWQPDTRLGSMMAPTLILARQSRYALGSGGSNRIRSAILQVISGLIDLELTPTEAVHAPRMHFEAGLLSLEPGIQPAVVEALTNAVGSLKQWDSMNLFFGGVHLVAGHADYFEAVGDPRRGGVGRLANG